METDSNSNISYLEKLNYKQTLVNLPVIIFLGILMVLGIFGNSAVCYVYGCRFKKNVANSCILALAIFDITNCVIAIPARITDLVLPLEFPSGWVCKLLRFSTFFTSLASGIVLVEIAIDRYLKVCHPLQRKTRFNRSRIMVVTAILLSLIFSWPSLVIFGQGSPRVNGAFVNGSSCSVQDHLKETKWPLIYSIATGSLMISALTILVIVYSLLIIKLCLRYREPSILPASKRKISKCTVSDISMFRLRQKYSLQQPESPLRVSYRHIPNVKLGKTYIILIVITLLFILCFLPCITLAIYGYTNRSLFLNLIGHQKILYEFGMASFFLSNMLNPIVYGFCNERFRHELNGLFVGSCKNS